MSQYGSAKAAEESTPLNPHADAEPFEYRKPTVRQLFVAGIRKYTAEFIGTTIFVFIGILSGNTNTGYLVAQGESAEEQTAVLSASAGNLLPAFAHGLTIAVMIFSFGHVSGGHFNPAVTVSVWLGKGMAVHDVLFYIASQIVGGFAGAVLAWVLITDQRYSVLDGGLITMTGQTSWLQGIICELILAFVLCSAVLSAESNDGTIPIGLAVGLAVFIDILAGAKVSGAAMNPARTVGPAIAGTIFGASDPWNSWYVYIAGPFAGALVAVVTYKFITARDDRRWLK